MEIAAVLAALGLAGLGLLVWLSGRAAKQKERTRQLKQGDAAQEREDEAIRKLRGRALSRARRRQYDRRMHDVSNGGGSA